MKQWRMVIMGVLATLVVLLIVQLSSSFSVSKANEQPTVGVKILSRNIESTTSPVVFTKNFSRKIQSKGESKRKALAKWKSNKTASNKHTHFCWEEEPIQVLGECIHCSNYEKRVSPVCLITGNKQLVMCLETKKKVYKSCPHVKWLEERNFWTFEGVALVLLICSSISVYQRNKKLDAIFHEKLRKRVSSDNV